MTSLSNGLINVDLPHAPARPVRRKAAPEREQRQPNRDPEFLRRVAWEIGERRAADHYAPTDNHVALALVSPYQGFAHWRIGQEWTNQTAWSRGQRWHNCRLVLRLYDVSYIEFNGLNAHRIQDHDLPGLCGQFFFRLPRPGTSQIGEVGFLLRDGEFIPASRSRSTTFAADSACGRGSTAALFVRGPGRLEDIGNVWDQERVLNERRQPKMRQRLRVALFSAEGTPSRFVAELAAGKCARGHEVHLFLPAGGEAVIDGVVPHRLELNGDGTPLDRARSFARAAAQRLGELPPFDLFHLHEWQTGFVPRPVDRPAVLSLGSLETTRRNGGPVTQLSTAIEEAEREAARTVGCVLTPDWLRDRAGAELGREVYAFPMEGRLANEWECPLDLGDVKREIGVGPVDRLFLYVGPLEFAAGVDLLIEALPVLLQRAHNLRLAFAGSGPMHGQLADRARERGVGHAVRLLGHVERPQLVRLLRAMEALVQPSRYRVPFDDAVVDLARRAGRPVVTTHGGPAHLVRHEENGILTYDNPGSMVWALDRIIGDAGHADRMGRHGRRSDASAVVWSEVAGRYLDFCATQFPALTHTEW
jgi:glycosyltransferase involved in cell wall biosynthesis